MHGADDIDHGVQADDVRGAIGGALGPADLGAGEGIDGIETKAEALGVVHHRQDREDADPVGDEVGGVLGAHDALAQAGNQPGFQVVHGGGVGVAGGDQFDQRHVARRIEEMDAAEPAAGFGRQRFGQAVDRQAGGVGGDDGVGRNVRRDLAVEIVLPFHLFGDGFDDQVAFGQLLKMLLVVGHVDVGDAALAGEGCRLQLLEAVDGLLDDAVLVAFLGRQVEQHHRHIGVGEMGGDLGAHDAGTQHRDAADQEIPSLHKCLH